MGEMMTALSWQQLSLDIGLVEPPSFDNFIVGSNRLLMLQLQAWCAANSEPMLLLVGAQGEGVSHLLQSCYHQLEAQDQAVVYVSLANEHLDPDHLIDLAAFDFLCLDDLHKVVGDPVWERQLFFLLNEVRVQGGRLLLGGKESLGQMPLTLPDLRSRLAWGLTLVLKPLADQQKIQALQQRAAERGLALSAELGDYILTRSGRSLGELMVVLEQLDQASMRARRKLTQAFVRQEMGW